ncbi:MAG: hypothetical protein ACYC6A_00795 [Armatimonadota bacterium]
MLKLTTVEVKKVDLSKMTEAMKDHARKALKPGLRRLARGANRRAPKDTEPRISKRGKVMKLSKSYKSWTFKKGIGGKVASFDPVAHLIELGTRGGVMTVKKARVLYDKVYDLYYGKKVTIPARPAQPHLGPAADAEFASIERDLEQYIGEAIDRAT